MVGFVGLLLKLLLKREGKGCGEPLVGKEHTDLKFFQYGTVSYQSFCLDQGFRTKIVLAGLFHDRRVPVSMLVVSRCVVSLIWLT